MEKEGQVKVLQMETNFGTVCLMEDGATYHYLAEWNNCMIYHDGPNRPLPVWKKNSVHEQLISAFINALIQHYKEDLNGLSFEQVKNFMEDSLNNDVIRLFVTPTSKEKITKFPFNIEIVDKNEKLLEVLADERLLNLAFIETKVLSEYSKYYGFVFIGYKWNMCIVVEEVGNFYKIFFFLLKFIFKLL